MSVNSQWQPVWRFLWESKRFATHKANANFPLVPDKARPMMQTLNMANPAHSGHLRSFRFVTSGARLSVDVSDVLEMLESGVGIQDVVCGTYRAT